MRNGTNISDSIQTILTSTLVDGCCIALIQMVYLIPLDWYTIALGYFRMPISLVINLQNIGLLGIDFITTAYIIVNKGFSEGLIAFAFFTAALAGYVSFLHYNGYLWAESGWLFLVFSDPIIQLCLQSNSLRCWTRLLLNWITMISSSSEKK